jgi:mRNA (2'-O-methyladenosine-N6-)-methyltransferase
MMPSKTYINCDLRFFNYELITSRIGFFDVIMLDPPWRIKGGQRNDSSFMFSNSKFNLEYNTMSNNEIISIPVEKLSKKGFCFLWVLNSLMNVGYECLNKWGYDVVDQITWVKTRNEKLYISQGYYFLHSSETCLVGYKCPPNERVEYKSKVKSHFLNKF